MSELIGKIIALGATLFLIVVAVVVGSKVFSSTTTVSEIQNLNTIVSNVRNLYANQPNYNGLTTAVAIQAGVFPSNMVQGNTAVNKWGGQVTLAQNTSNPNAFDLTYTNVPQDQCIQLVNNTQASNLVSVAVNGTTLNPPLNPGQIANACNNPTNNTITWTIR